MNFKVSSLKLYMRLISLFATLIQLLACNTSEKSTLETGDFNDEMYTITLSGKSEFKKVPYGSVHAIAFDEEGSIQNNSSDILKAAFVTMNIVFKLTNGNEIANKELDPYPFMFPSYETLLKGQFFPKELKQFKLSSPRIPKEYINYPIESVFIQYILTAEKPVQNNEKIKYLIYQRDVTLRWREFSKSVTGLQ